MKNLLTTSAILALLFSTVTMAEETQTENTTEWVEEVETDFGTDSYDVDGCFC
ncbi:MAG: hypothetical protein L3J43_02085 [Sulfurovum sp.]|nr:hypothetical protein [Sulfurovum sp.]